MRWGKLRHEVFSWVHPEELREFGCHLRLVLLLLDGVTGHDLLEVERALICEREDLLGFLNRRH